MSELQNSVSSTGNITTDDVVLQGPTLAAKYTDEGTAKLVVGDMARAQAFQVEKQWTLHWNESDVLYQSPRGADTFEKSVVSRSNVARFTVAKQVNTLAPMIEQGLFYETPPFLIRPRPGQNQRTAFAKMALYGALLDEIDFQGECGLAIEGGVNSGTAICKGGWCTEKKTIRTQVRKASPVKVSMPFAPDGAMVHTAESDEFDVVETEVTINRPFFEWVPLGSIYVDPKWKSANRLDKAKYVIHQTYPTFNDLDKLREDDSYDIPSEQELKDYFFAHEGDATPPSVITQQETNNAAIYHGAADNEVTSEDPMERPIEMLERWDDTYVRTILRTDDDHVVVIRKNYQHGMRRHCFFSWNFWNIPGAGYGLGVGRLAGSDQRVEKGLVDGALDILSFALNPSYYRARGANVPTQQIRTRLGGIVDVDAPEHGTARDAFGIIEQPKVPAEVFPLLQNAQQSSQSTTGADEAFGQGSIPGRGSSVVRTATGAGGVIAANAGRIQGPVGRFVRGIFLPFIEMLDEMCKERLPLTEMREILGKELGDAFEMDEADFLNSNDKFEVLAGAKLAAKKAMAQALPLMIQVLENPALIAQLNATGYTVDAKLLFDMFMEVSEWRDNRELIRPMTPPEAQKFAAANPGIQKVQGDLAVVAAKHEAKSQEIDQNHEAALASKMMLNSNAEAAAYVMRQVERQQMREGFGAM
jgi:hypothetical protein